MSLQTVLSFINVAPGSANDGFVNQIQSLIGMLYAGSPTLRFALDNRIVLGSPLNISFVPGTMNNVSIDYLGINVDVIQIDPSFADQFLSINQFWNTVARGFSYMFVHELCHALFGYSDPDLDNLNAVGFDFLGDTVRSENLVLSELGITSNRIGYFSAFLENIDYQPAYTGGSTIDYAFKNDFGFAFVDASQSMQKDERGLLIGSISSDSFTGGEQNASTIRLELLVRGSLCLAFHLNGSIH